MAISPARRAAYEILLQVAEGSHSTDLLYQRTRQLSGRDAGLAGELVLGTLRFENQLNYLIRHFSGRDASELDFELRLGLRLGIYQLRYLDRIPPHAAIFESVELVKRYHQRSAAGLANAVLRKVNRDPVAWPSREIALCHPEWLLEGWEKSFGPGSAEQIANAFLRPPMTYIRVPRGGEVAGLDVEETELPGCYRLLSGDPGGYRHQDIGSQSIVPLLDLQPGHRLLDLCCSPGNKTAQAMEHGISAVACDISFRRLGFAASTGATLVNLDARERLPFRQPFERILLDAPCSGTGTIGRNPEIKWRVHPDDLEFQKRRQIRMIRSAFDLLAPGGLLVYSTCSLEPEENEHVVDTFASLPEIEVERSIRRIPGRDPGDGFYAAVLRRVSPASPSAT